MIGNIAAFNEEILKERRRELGHLPLPACFSEAELRDAVELWESDERSGSLPRVPYVGRERIKGFRLVGEEVFVDTSGWGAPDEPALTQGQFLKHMLEQTRKHGTLWWGLTTVGQFQGYVRAWKHKGA
jgi:hypothetical protein